MSKLITSPVQRFPGTVTISDPLTIPQVFAFQEGVAKIRALGENPPIEQANLAILPGVIACVEKWELKGMGEKFDANPGLETFPGTPGISSAKLIAWLITEISSLFREANEVPNA